MIVKSRARRMPVTRTAALGLTGALRGTSAQHVVFYLLLAFLLTCLVGGGSNRPNILPLLYLRPLTVIFLSAMLIVPTAWEFRSVRFPLLVLGVLAVWMMVQLVPLPPSVWIHLPGREPFAQAAVALDGVQPWRPISLTPDLTINSLLALLIPLTVLIGFAGIRPDQRLALVPLIIGAAIASAALGILQFTGGQSSPANLYDHSLPVPNGWFANRNHHAAFLACALAVTATWLRLPAQSSRYARQRYWIAGLTAGLLLVVAIATGSRSGTLLTVLALAYATTTTLRTFSGKLSARNTVLLRTAVAIVSLLVVTVMLFVGRAVSLNRALGFDPESEQRIRAFPTLLAMWRDFMPFGSGFGSFEPIFRVYEPDTLLHPGYFNHAHNDWLELGITGGLPATLILAGFTVWVGVRLLRCFRMRASSTVLCARSGGIILLILGAASVTDYPLRTPLLAALFALACAWLADASRHDPAA
jgi:O-antigen ligase